MAIFQPRDDDAFIAWLDANPNGYVVNTGRGARGYVMLHRATCNLVRKWPPFIGPSVKLCSTSLDHLEQWAVQFTGGPAPAARLGVRAAGSELS
ncbi:MAG: hypothetical protein ACRDPY_21100 [Streptosporangiaceae bacterium]